MRLSDYLYLASKNLSRRKKSVVINVFLIMIAMLIFIVALSFTNHFLNAMNKAINQNISYRTIAVLDYDENSQKELMDQISQINFVERVMTSEEYETRVELKELDGNISLIGADHEITPNIIAGRGILPGENGVCIIPEKFYPYNDLYQNFDPEKIIDGKSLIDKKIKITYHSYDFSNGVNTLNQTFEKELTVIGVYNQDENINDYNYCYASFEDVQAINKELEENTIYAENVIYFKANSIYTIVDEAKNVEEVLNEIRNLDCRAIIKSTANIELIDTINLVFLIIFIFLCIISIISITVSSIKSISERKYEIGMQKAIGYKNKEIQKILLTENFLIGIFSYIPTLILAMLIVYFVKVIMIPSNFQLQQIGVGLDFSVCFIAFIISLCIPLFSSILCGKKILQKTPISLNKEG